MDDVRIVFVAGYARTGSTLLDRLLGEVQGFGSFGELRHVWDRGFVGDQLCGCGLPFRECPHWSAVASSAFGGFDGVDALALSRDKTSIDAFWNIPRMLADRWRPAQRDRLVTYASAVGSLYRAMQRVGGLTCIVDSTKDPQHAYLLKHVLGFDVRIVHLVRDSRPVAFSWRRVRRRPEVTWETRDMPRHPIVRTAVAWDLANLAADATRFAGFPYTRVRYEDLVSDPRAEIDRVLGDLGLGPAELGFIGTGTATLGPAHTVAGNPMRFREGVIEIRPDTEWVRAMSPVERAVVTAGTWPLLLRYGYRPTGGRRRRAAAARPQDAQAHGGTWRILRSARNVRRDPVPFFRAIAGQCVRYLDGRGVELSGARWLDVGAGSGALVAALASAGAEPMGVDLSDRRLRGMEGIPFVLARGERLPFDDGSFDGVTSSNVLEHARDPWGMLDELLRVLRPGGVLYLSWTNWYSPFGGHDWSPFHYLGPTVGPRVYRAVRGRAVLHVPGRTLFPVHVGDVLRSVRARSLEVVDVAPRYWPSLRFLARVPGVREVALWNCVVLVRRPPAPPGGVPTAVRTEPRPPDPA